MSAINSDLTQSAVKNDVPAVRQYVDRAVRQERELLQSIDVLILNMVINLVTCAVVLASIHDHSLELCDIEEQLFAQKKSHAESISAWANAHQGRFIQDTMESFLSYTPRTQDAIFLGLEYLMRGRGGFLK